MRQKSCPKKECQKARKRESQRDWSTKNPDYYRGRYGDLTRWREQNPDYQRQWRALRREIQDKKVSKFPLKSIRLHVPEHVVEMLASEIQDEMTQMELEFEVIPRSYADFLDVDEGREIQDTFAFCSGRIVNRSA